MPSLKDGHAAIAITTDPNFQEIEACRDEPHAGHLAPTHETVPT